MTGFSRRTAPVGEVSQPGPVRLDDEEDRPAAGGPHRRRAGGRDERAAGAYQRGGALEDFTPDHVERDVDRAGVLQPVGLQVHERVRTQAEGGLPVPGTAGADHAGAQLVGELHRDRPDAARGAVDQDGLARVSYGDGLHNDSLLRRIQVLAVADVPDHPAGAPELTAVTGQDWLDQIMPARLPETAPTQWCR